MCSKSAQTKKKVDQLAGQAQDLRDLLNKLERKKKQEEQKAREEAKKLAETQTDSLIKFKAPIINEVGDNL